MSKKLLALVLALGMCVSMASCADLLGALSNGSETSSTTSEVTSTPEDTTSEEKPGSSEVGGGTSEDGGNESKKEYVKVTFKQVGQEDIVKTVEKGTALTDIPTPAAKTGYTVTWSVNAFANITENMTVNAEETAKTYTVVCKSPIQGITVGTISVTYGQAYTLPEVTVDKEYFLGWTYNGTSVNATGTWAIDGDSTIILTAAFVPGWTGNY